VLWIAVSRIFWWEYGRAEPNLCHASTHQPRRAAWAGCIEDLVDSLAMA
jgi:hypothetical protein